MFFSSQDITIYYEKYGSGKKCILILPGWGNTRASFRHMIDFFKDSYTIYIIDYPAFGNSPIPRKTLDIFLYSKIIKDFLEKEKIEQPIIIAHSFGGRISAILSGYYKIKFEKLLFIDVAGIKPRKTLKQLIKQSIYKILRRMIKLLPKLKQEYYYQKLIKSFGSTDYNNLPVTMQNTFKNIVNKDLKKYFKNIDDKVLILWGKNDKTTPLKDGIKLKKLIKKAELIILPGGHFLYLDYIFLTNKIIDAFLNEKD